MIITQNNQGDIMCKTTWCLIHITAALAISCATCYIVLNEMGKLDKVKSDIYNKAMDIKDDITNKLK